MPLSTIPSAGLDSQAQFTGFKNRIINGNMRIDQRNAGASVTLAASTSGTWQTGNAMGIDLIFTLAVGSTYQQAAGAWGATAFAIGTSGQTNFLGTSGATFYITGVQLECGSNATSFEVIDYGRQLMQCQRYFSKSFLAGQSPVQNVGSTAGCLVYTTQATNTQFITAQTSLPVIMRAAPTVTTFNPFAANTGWSGSGAGNFTVSPYSLGDSSIALRNDTIVNSAGSNMLIHWTASAEL